MQISAANLLATQSQATNRSGAAAAAFEPIAFKQTPPPAVSQPPAQAPAAKPAAMASQAAAPLNGPPASTSASFGGGYVRPGSNIDIRI